MRVIDLIGGKSRGVAAAALCAVLLAASPVMAQHDGGHAGGAAVSGRGGGSQIGRSSGGGARSFSGGTSHSFAGRSGSSGRVYGYRDARRFRRHGRNGVVFGYDYGYVGSCEYYRRRALATGSRYWWSRYHRCVGDY